MAVRGCPREPDLPASARGGQPEIIREQSGSSNGMTFDLRGRLLICEGDNRQVTRRKPDGTYTPLAQRRGGKAHQPAQ